MFGFGKTSIDTDPTKIDELLTRSVTEVIEKEHLRKRLLSGERLRVKHGADPTSPNLHLGRAVQLLKLKDFQDLGHKIVFIVGDFTGVIGDTSDKESERPMLKREVIEENKKTYFEQAGRVLDLSQVETKYNSEWLSKLTYKEIGEHADKFSVSDFIARENIKKRLDAGKRVSLREMLYPLMQGYDSVAVRADVEIGATDQRFNMLSGRVLQESAGQEPQDIVMSGLIPGTDGRKMSSSWGNTINLTDESDNMYGKVMSIGDGVVETYFHSCTRVPIPEIDKMMKEHPRDSKMRLAREIVTLYHGVKEAEVAEENFVSTFKEQKPPSDIPVFRAREGALLVDILVKSGEVSSKTDARRLLKDGAVTDMDTQTKVIAETVEKTITLRIGKKRFLKVEIES
jgi:tyrosyl-tRNA synthetase